MKPKVSIIVAIDEKRGIGKTDRIPWHIREDLIRLKNLTKDKVVILGRKSYESMVGYYDRSGRPMPARLYLVITRDQDYKPVRENAKSAHSIEDAITGLQEEEVFIIGGAQIFQKAIDMGVVDRLYLTKVEGDFDCDTFFPDYSEFKKVISEEEGEENGIKYKFIDFEK